MTETPKLSEGCLARALDLSTSQANAALYALCAVASADGEPGFKSAHLIDIARMALGVPLGEAAVDPVEAFPKLADRRMLVDALLLPACIEGEVSLGRERAVFALAKQLGVRSYWASLLPALRRRQVFAVKRALARRAPDLRRILQRVRKEEGVLGFIRVFVFMAGFHRDSELAARFRALAACPAGSFGRAVTDHFEQRGLSFPGEKGGLPERMVHHDLMHVLNAYDTDAAGECELAAFYCALADGDAFTFIVIVLATFHLGLRVSPSIVTPTRGMFDPERAIASFLRGRLVCVDIMGPWNYWELMPLPMAEVRARLGVVKRSAGQS